MYHSLKCPSHVQPQAVCKMIYFMNDIRSIRGGYGDIPQLLKGGFDGICICYIAFALSFEIVSKCILQNFTI